MLKASFTIYADLKSLPIKQKSCQNNPNEFYTEAKAMHEPWGYALSLISSLDSKKKINIVFIEEEIVLSFVVNNKNK